MKWNVDSLWRFVSARCLLISLFFLVLPFDCILTRKCTSLPDVYFFFLCVIYLIYVFFLFVLMFRLQKKSVFDPTRVTQLSWNPRFFFPHLFHFFFISKLFFFNFKLLPWFFFFLKLNRAFLYKGFLSDEECDHLMNLVGILYVCLIAQLILIVI